MDGEAFTSHYVQNHMAGYAAGAESLYARLLKEAPDLAREFGPTVTPEMLRTECARLEAKINRHDNEAGVFRATIAHLEWAKARSDESGGEWKFRLRPRDYHFGAGSRLRAHELVQQAANEFGLRLLAYQRKKKVLGREGIIETDELEAVDEASDCARLIDGAHKFDLRCLRSEDVEANSAFADELEAAGLLQSPFSVAWYEFEIKPDATIGVLKCDAAPTKVFGRIEGAGWIDWSKLLGQTEVCLEVDQIIRAAAVLMSSQCATKHNLPAPIALNKKRAAVGKVPIYSHTVVEIRGFRIGKNGDVVGTHRSPRMHWRRGHLRRYRDPEGNVLRTIAIAPVLVGKDETAVIEHEYRVRPQRAAA
jgi:hypothetical protein